MTRNLTSASRSRVQDLREAFDSSFSVAPVTATKASESLLAIRVGRVPYAIRLSETAGLHVDKPVTRLPGTPPELLGIAGLRGTITTVFDLRVLLGVEPTEEGRWLVLASTSPAVGFAFDHFEGQFQVSGDSIATSANSVHDGSNPVERLVGDSGHGGRSIVSIRELVESITSGIAVA